MKAWIWKIALALAGCVAGAYVGQELVGGGALGWTATGAIMAVTCAPMFRAIIEYRKSR